MKDRIFKKLYYCHDCDVLVILKSKWFRCPKCTSSKLTERGDFINFDYSQKQLSDMLHKHGCFATAIKRLKHHNIDVRKTVFAPKLPENISREDLITVVDLAVNAGIKKLIIPPNDDFNSLKRRAVVHSCGNLMVTMHG